MESEASDIEKQNDSNNNNQSDRGLENEKSTGLFNEMISLSKIKYKSPENNDIIKGIRFASKLYKIAKTTTEAKNTDECRNLIKECLAVIKNENENLNRIFSPLLQLVKYLRSANGQKINQTNLEQNDNNNNNNNNQKNLTENLTVNYQEENKKDEDIELETSKHEIENNQESDLEDLSEKDKHALKRIKKLDEFCLKLNQKILEEEANEAELSQLDSAGGCYIIESSLKKKFNKAYKKLVYLMKKNPHLIETDIRPKKVVGGVFATKINYKFTRYKEINEKICAKLNKLKQLPDYFDVLNWITEANNQDALGLTEEQIKTLAKEILRDTCLIAKERRISDDRLITKSRIDSLRKLDPNYEAKKLQEANKMDELNYDPAEEDAELEEKLRQNYEMAVEQQNKIIDEYVYKQNNNEDFEVKTDDEEDDDDDDEKDNYENSSSTEIDNTHFEEDDLVPNSQDLDPKETNLKEKKTNTKIFDTPSNLEEPNELSRIPEEDDEKSNENKQQEIVKELPIQQEIVSESKTILQLEDKKNQPNQNETTFFKSAESSLDEDTYKTVVDLSSMLVLSQKIEDQKLESSHGLEEHNVNSTKSNVHSTPVTQKICKFRKSIEKRSGNKNLKRKLENDLSNDGIYLHGIAIEDTNIPLRYSKKLNLELNYENEKITINNNKETLNRKTIVSFLKNETCINVQSLNKNQLTTSNKNTIDSIDDCIVLD